MTTRISVTGRVITIYADSEQSVQAITDAVMSAAPGAAFSKTTAHDATPFWITAIWAKFTSVMASKNGLVWENLVGETRVRPYPMMRRAVVLAWKEEMGESFKAIGRRLNMDHSSVMSMHRKAVEAIYQDERDLIDMARRELAEIMKMA